MELCEIAENISAKDNKSRPCAPSLYHGVHFRIFRSLALISGHVEVTMHAMENILKGNSTVNMTLEDAAYLYALNRVYKFDNTKTHEDISDYALRVFEGLAEKGARTHYKPTYRVEYTVTDVIQLSLEIAEELVHHSSDYYLEITTLLVNKYLSENEGSIVFFVPRSLFDMYGMHRAESPIDRFALFIRDHCLHFCSGESNIVVNRANVSRLGSYCERGNIECFLYPEYNRHMTEAEFLRVFDFIMSHAGSKEVEDNGKVCTLELTYPASSISLVATSRDTVRSIFIYVNKNCAGSIVMGNTYPPVMDIINDIALSAMWYVLESV